MSSRITVAFGIDDEGCHVSLRVQHQDQAINCRFPGEYARELSERLTNVADAYDWATETGDFAPTKPPADASGESVLPPGPDPQPSGL